MNKIKEYLKSYQSYHKIARIWWDTLDDIKAWRFLFLSNMPGRLGIYLRAKWLVKLFGSCGKSPVILEGIRIDNPKRLIVGDHFRSNVGLYISAGGGVEIGNNVLIGPFVKIWSINHVFDRIDQPIIDQGWRKQKVIIEDDVWIGASAIILPGVHVGQGSVIAAGSVLNRSVKPYSLVAGNPARPYGYRNKKKDSRE